MSNFKKLKKFIYELSPSYRYLQKIDKKYSDKFDSLLNTLSFSDTNTNSKMDQVINALNNPLTGVHFKINSLNDSLNTVFRYLSGLQLNQNYMVERVIAFAPEEAAVEHYKRYIHVLNLINSSTTLLDISCGTGYGTNLLAQKACHVTGVDISKPAIDFAKKFFSKENINFIQGDGLSFKSEKKFDMIVSFETVEHIQDDNSFINNISNLLKDDGIFICSVPNESTFSHEIYKTPFHFKHYLKSELIKLLENNNFKVEKVLHQYFDSSDVQDLKDDTEGFTLIAVARKVNK